MIKNSLPKSLVFLSLPLAVGLATAQSIRTISFPVGKSSATINGRVEGRQSIDYRVTLGAGQTLSVRLDSPSRSVYFNVLPPGSENTAMVIGEAVGNRATRVVPIEGSYTVRVFLVRAAGRRNERAGFRLNVSATGSPLPAVKDGRDALVAGTRFHATAEVPMEHFLLRDLKTANAGVIRRTPSGSATVILSFRNEKRTLLFRSGRLVGWDSTAAATAKKDGDMFTVRIGDGDEIYRFPESLLMGG